MTTTTLRYTGPAAFVSLLAQRLRENGGEVTYEPPVEQRGGAGDLAHHAVMIAVDGMAFEVMKATVAAVVQRFPSVRVEPVDEEEQADQDPPAPA